MAFYPEQKRIIINNLYLNKSQLELYYMNANELYENLKNIGKPLIHVESIEATMHMNIPVEEIDKYIEIIGVNFLLVEILRFDFSDVFSQKNKRYIAEYIIENKADQLFLARLLFFIRHWQTISVYDSINVCEIKGILAYAKSNNIFPSF